MKIGMYIGTIPAPVFIENLINGLAKNGQRVFIYGKLIDKEFKIENSNIILRKFPNSKFKIVISFIYLFYKALICKSYSCIFLLKIIWTNSNTISQFFNRFCRLIPPFIDDIDILHIQWAKMLVNYSEFIDYINCPIVLSLRGAHINYSPLADIKLADGYRRYFPFVAKFHAVSNAISLEAQKYFALPSDIKVIPPAVNYEQIANINIDTKQNEKFEIVSVGRCHWKKGYTFALDAMKILKDKGINFHYTIIASGIDKENILYQISNLDLKKHVTFINGLPHKQVLKKILQLDLFLLPSLSEGISNAALEAMAIGIPLLSANCGGMDEVIIHGENGFLFQIRDVAGLAAQIDEIIKMKIDRINKIIAAAKSTIYENHLLDLQIKEMLLLYKSLNKN